MGVFFSAVVFNPESTTNNMKTYSIIAGIIVAILILLSHSSQAQDDINTVFTGGGLSHSGGYGALVNKFTTIDGKFANITEIYGGWFINRKFMIGAGGGATTNRITVPDQWKAIEDEDLSYEYGQFGLVTEYVLGSNKTIHAVFHLMAGAGFTLQYIREGYNRYYYEENDYRTDVNWFMVAEPGVQVEINLLKWMRFSPGLSYRFAQNSKFEGLSDNALSGTSVNLALKFGKF